MDSTSKNLLLEQLTAPYRETLLAVLEPVTLALRETVVDAEQTPKFVHFVTSGMVSVVMYMKNGDGVEVGMVGHEGLAEAYQLLGSVKAPTTAFVQMEATALRMPFEIMQREFRREREMRDVVLQYVQSLAYASAPLTACNRRHTVEQRMARWLLMVSDRVQANTFNLTQEFLAEMLGASRSTVTLAARRLHQAGLLDYRRGNVVLSNRAGLEAAACECYTVIRGLKPDQARS